MSAEIVEIAAILLMDQQLSNRNAWSHIFDKNVYQAFTK